MHFIEIDIKERNTLTNARDCARIQHLVSYGDINKAMFVMYLHLCLLMSTRMRKSFAQKSKLEGHQCENFAR